MDAIQKLVSAFLKTESWLDTKHLLERHHAELLSDEALAVIDELYAYAWQMQDQAAMTTLQQHRRLLERSREIGIPEAFVELTGQWETLSPPSLAPKVEEAIAVSQRYARSQELHHLDAAVAAWVGLLRDPGFSTAPPRFQLGVLDQAARDFLFKYRSSGEAVYLNRAIELLKRGLGQLSHDAPDLVRFLDNLALTLMTRYEEGGRPDDLNETVQALEQGLALDVEDADHFAMRLSNLSNALRERYEVNGDRFDLHRAVETRLYEVV
jgi:hypothetical protein